MGMCHIKDSTEHSHVASPWGLLTPRLARQQSSVKEGSGAACRTLADFDRCNGLQAYSPEEGAGAPAPPPGVADDLAVLRSFETLNQQHAGGNDGVSGRRHNLMMFFTAHKAE